MKSPSNADQNSRRIFMIKAASAGITLGVAASVSAQSMLSESDAQAVALSYKADASKVDKAKQPKYAAGQLCSNCALFQAPAGAAAGIAAAPVPASTARLLTFMESE